MPITLLRPQEVAERYGVGPERLQTLIESGALTPIQVGGEALVCEDDLVAQIGQPPNGNNHDRWVPLSAAVAQHPEVDAAVLRKLVNDNIIPSKTPPDAPEPLVDIHELAAVAERLDGRQWQHLRGQGISINAAAKKYGLHSPTLLNWVRAGHIRVLRRDNYRVYLDEADVGFARALFDVAGKQGRALFPSR